MDMTEAYLSFTLCVLQADGRVDDGEARLFASMLRHAGVRADLRRKYERFLRGEAELDPAKVLASMPEMLDEMLLMWLVRDAYLVAGADGVVSEPEEALIQDLLRHVGIPESRFGEIRAWGMEAVRHARTGATLFTVA
jgi:uncharacterized membrane protein YebE (DUF533 family)